MKVNELIELLKDMPQDAEVVVGQGIGSYEPCCGVKQDNITDNFSGEKIRAVTIEIE